MSQYMGRKEQDDSRRANSYAFSFSMTEALERLVGGRVPSLSLQRDASQATVATKQEQGMKDGDTTAKYIVPALKSAPHKNGAHISPEDYALMNEYCQRVLARNNSVNSSLSSTLSPSTTMSPEYVKSNDFLESFESANFDDLQILAVNDHCLSRSMLQSICASASMCHDLQVECGTSLEGKQTEEIVETERRQDNHAGEDAYNLALEVIDDQRQDCVACEEAQLQCDEWELSCGFMSEDCLMEVEGLPAPSSHKAFLLMPEDSLMSSARNGPIILAPSSQEGRPLFKYPIPSSDCSDCSNIQIVAEVGVTNASAKSCSDNEARQKRQPGQQPDSLQLRHDNVTIHIDEDEIDVQWAKESMGNRSTASSISSAEGRTVCGSNKDVEPGLGKIMSNEVETSPASDTTNQSGRTAALSERKAAGYLPFFASPILYAPADIFTEDDEAASENSSITSASISSNSRPESNYTETQVCSDNRTDAPGFRQSGAATTSFLWSSASGSPPAARGQRTIASLSKSLLLPSRNKSLGDSDDREDESSFPQQLRAPAKAQAQQEHSRSRQKPLLQPEGFWNKDKRTLSGVREPEGDLLKCGSSLLGMLGPENDIRSHDSFHYEESSLATASTASSRARNGAVTASTRSASASSEHRGSRDSMSVDSKSSAPGVRGNFPDSMRSISTDRIHMSETSHNILEFESRSGETTFVTNESSSTCQPRSSFSAFPSSFSRHNDYSLGTDDEYDQSRSFESVSQLLSTGNDELTDPSFDTKANLFQSSASMGSLRFDCQQRVDLTMSGSAFDANDIERRSENRDDAGKLQLQHSGSKKAPNSNKNESFASWTFSTEKMTDTGETTDGTSSLTGEGRRQTRRAMSSPPEFADQERSQTVEGQLSATLCKTADAERANENDRQDEVEVFLVNDRILVNASTPVKEVKPRQPAAKVPPETSPRPDVSEQGTSDDDLNKEWQDKKTDQAPLLSSLSRRPNENSSKTTPPEALAQPYAIKSLKNQSNDGPIPAKEYALVTSLIRKVSSYDVQIIANKTRRQLMRTALSPARFANVIREKGEAAAGESHLQGKQATVRRWEKQPSRAQSLLTMYSSSSSSGSNSREHKSSTLPKATSHNSSSCSTEDSLSVEHWSSLSNPENELKGLTGQGIYSATCTENAQSKLGSPSKKERDPPTHQTDSLQGQQMEGLSELKLIESARLQPEPPAEKEDKLSSLVGSKAMQSDQREVNVCGAGRSVEVQTLQKHEYLPELSGHGGCPTKANRMYITPHELPSTTTAERVEIHEIDLELAVSSPPNRCTERSPGMDSPQEKGSYKDDGEAGLELAEQADHQGDTIYPPYLAVSSASEESALESMSNEFAILLGTQPEESGQGTSDLDGVDNEASRPGRSMFGQFLSKLSNIRWRRAPENPLLEPLLPLSASALESPFWLANGPYAANEGRNTAVSQLRLGLVFSAEESFQDPDDLDLEAGQSTSDTTNTSRAQPLPENVWRIHSDLAHSATHAPSDQGAIVMTGQRSTNVCVRMLEKCWSFKFIWSLLGFMLTFSVFSVVLLTFSP